MAAWVEQWYALAGQWVSRAGLSRLVVVAQATGEPEVFLVVGPAGGPRDDVLDFERTQNVLLRAQTVSAAITGSGPNLRP